MEAKSVNAQEQVRGWMATLGARSALAFLFFYAFFLGCWIAGAGLHDPDTCWLLAVGKEIVDRGSIPQIDPFSYTFRCLAPDGTLNLDALLKETPFNEHRTFVPYQWLTEVLFSVAYKIGAGYGLLVLVTCVLVSGLLVGPLLFYRALRSPMSIGILVVILGVVAASFHTLARPEIFSYLFQTIFLGLFLRVRLKLENNRPFKQRDLVLLTPFFVLMAVWANLHTGFMSSLIVMSVFCATTTPEILLRKKVRNSVLVMPWLVFITLIAGTFLNPFGVALWQYVPQLFFSPFNRFIDELKPLSLAHLQDWTFYPYLLLGVVSWVVIAKAYKVWKSRGRFPIGFSFSVVMTIAVFIAGVCCLRLMPFASLFIVTEIAWLLKGHTRLPRQVETDGAGLDGSLEAGGTPAVPGAALSDPSDVNLRLARSLGESNWPVMLILFSLLGVLLISTRVAKPFIPQESGAFVAPYKAIEFLARELPEGRVFNDAQFGDMMIWYLIAQEKPILAQDPLSVGEVARTPQVFIDTRYDMYGSPLVFDYYNMSTMKPGWEEVFQRYQFDWVFLPPRTALAKHLVSDPGWKVLFEDESAVILVRSAGGF